MPIKRNDDIVPLSQDHHLSLLFGWKIKQGLKASVSVSRMLAYVRYFEDVHLTPHFTEEEELLFGPNKENEMVQKGLQDHTDIKDIISRLYEGPNEQDQLAQLALLASAVETHVRFEERELFPALEKLILPQLLSAVGAELRASHPVKNIDDFADEFWVVKK